MNSSKKWIFWYALWLILAASALYLADFAVFKDAHSIFISVLSGIAFIPIQVLLVTLILEKFLRVREKQALIHKLNMVLGAFFSEVGSPLLKFFSIFEGENRALWQHLQLSPNWTMKDFLQAKKFLTQYTYHLDPLKLDMIKLRDFLASRRTFMLGLLENPNLLEHDRVTDMLWAILHLTEELLARKDLTRSKNKDLEHLGTDTLRAYAQLIPEWLQYMRHLKNDYPYLYSLAVRTNPFNAHACVEIP